MISFIRFRLVTINMGSLQMQVPTGGGFGVYCCCQIGLLLVVFIILILVYYYTRNSPRKQSNEEIFYCPQCGKAMEPNEEKCSKCGYEFDESKKEEVSKKRESAVQSDYEQKEGKVIQSEYGQEESGWLEGLIDSLKGKETCDECGSELEYKESMDSYYCPECHEYK